MLLCSCQTDCRREKIPRISHESEKEIKMLYSSCRLANKIRFDIFRRAIIGYKNIKLKNKDVITIIDFTEPSFAKRFFVINLKQKKLLFNTWTSHGRNSGGTYARKFSNKKGSKKSSLGFYKTAETYYGKHGYSLRLKGLEKGINHYARKRGIVIHGAGYVSKSFIKKYKRLGRSWGCPALPVQITKPVIDAIKDGTCLYIYADDKAYLTRSNYVEE
ncbi:MAG: murein L,D-transpeptidase catalytic domain family protein [Desulfobacterales bacterium]|nr:murein L,D-transpeptidase catalytic domain family protein [Desulfobacterales bacterium]